jgi:hypothetical protein
MNMKGTWYMVNLEIRNLKIRKTIIIQGVSKRALQMLMLIYIYSGDMHRILSSNNLAKHTEFYLG